MTFKSSDNIYFNANKINTTELLSRGEYLADREQVIVQNPEDYYLTIEKVYLNIETLPIIKVYDTVNGVRENLLKVSLLNSLSPIQPPALVTAELDFPANFPPISYYPNYFTEIYQFISSLQTAINTAFNIAYPQPTPFLRPEIEYFPSSGLMSISVQNLPGNPSGLVLYFNEALYDLLASFPFEIDTSSDLTYAKLIPAVLNLDAIYPPNTFVGRNYQITRLYQQYPSLFLLDQTQRFLISTSLIPIYKESVTSLNPSKDDNRPLLLTVDTDGKRRFTDNAFVLEIGDRKLIDLKTNMPLRTIEYKIEIEMADGTILPYYVRRGNSFGITFGFRDKRLYLDRGR
jgi:hypothetical protein